MQGCGNAQQVDVLVGLSEASGDHRRQFSHALGMLTGSVIAIFCRKRESVHDL
jgi:hypothetical protein